MAGRWVLGLSVVLAGSSFVTAGCSKQAAEVHHCGPIHREALDPNFVVHVLPGARRLHYLTNPPTSGAHQPAPRLARVQRRPLPRPVQVGILESGDVLVQYRDVSTADVTRLQKLAGGHVVVAPDPTLGPGARVVATGWTYKRTCSAFDPVGIRQFVERRAGKGPGAP